MNKTPWQLLLVCRVSHQQVFWAFLTPDKRSTQGWGVHMYEYIRNWIKVPPLQRVFLFGHHSSGSKFLRGKAISYIHYKQLYLDIVMHCKAITKQGQATISHFRNISCYIEPVQSSGMSTERLRVHGWRDLQWISFYHSFSVTISQTG